MTRVERIYPNKSGLDPEESWWTDEGFHAEVRVFYDEDNDSEQLLERRETCLAIGIYLD